MAQYGQFIDELISDELSRLVSALPAVSITTSLAPVAEQISAKVAP